MVRFIITIIGITIAGNCFSEAVDPIREFLKLTPDMEHELVKINFANDGLKKRDLRSRYSYGVPFTTRAFGKDVNLWLNPKDSLLISEETPVYFANYSSCAPGGVYIVKDEKGLMKNVAYRLYEDPERLASLIIGEDALGRTTFNGRIESENLVVRSLPDSVVKAHVAYRRSTDHANDETHDVAYHVVYRGNNNTLMEKDYSVNFNVSKIREKLITSGERIPHTLYPKILLYLDYTTYKEHGNDSIELLITYTVFMNGVDLKYRALERPNIRFHISGIVIATDPMGTPIIYDNMVDEEHFYGNRAMTKANKFFYEIRESIPLSTYDIASTITRLKIASNYSIIGKSWENTICSNTEEKQIVEAITITVEDGFFRGIHITAHELGHVLGVLHDPGTKEGDCAYTNGFLMAPAIVLTSNSSTFSDCSLEYLRSKIDVQKYTCLYDKPVVKARLLPKLMPGRFISLEQQCKGRGRGAPCNNTEDEVCVNIRCMENSYCTTTDNAALEGTVCSQPSSVLTKYCVFNRCVPV